MLGVGQEVRLLALRVDVCVSREMTRGRIRLGDSLVPGASKSQEKSLAQSTKVRISEILENVIVSSRRRERERQI